MLCIKLTQISLYPGLVTFSHLKGELQTVLRRERDRYPVSDKVPIIYKLQVSMQRPMCVRSRLGRVFTSSARYPILYRFCMLIVSAGGVTVSAARSM